MKFVPKISHFWKMFYIVSTVPKFEKFTVLIKLYQNFFIPKTFLHFSVYFDWADSPSQNRFMF